MMMFWHSCTAVFSCVDDNGCIGFKDDADYIDVDCINDNTIDQTIHTVYECKDMQTIELIVILKHCQIMGWLWIGYLSWLMPDW